ncbi:MAG: imidazole glycerol phosphate synthase subunit HisH [Nitrospinae bacterium]|nr:imidazole glycerol phosphate synthase subunit HisH [Nitrospinota bacterium]
MPIVIVDYDAGNLRSVQKAFEKIGAKAVVSRNPEDVVNAEALVLPGVGAFGECMAHLEKFGLVGAVKDFIASGRPFLGICVGYQILFEGSEESPGVTGLGVFKGQCLKFTPPREAGLKVPHMGWNQVRYTKSGKLFDGVADGSDFYFVHSYYPKPEEDIAVASTEYGVPFASAVERGSVFAVQFHPEKSQQAGLAVLRNFTARAVGLS